MLGVVRCVAFVCAPTMTILTRVTDSPDDRRERARLSELSRLREALRGPDVAKS